MRLRQRFRPPPRKCAQVLVYLSLVSSCRPSLWIIARVRTAEPARRSWGFGGIPGHLYTSASRRALTRRGAWRLNHRRTRSPWHQLRYSPPSYPERAPELPSNRQLFSALTSLVAYSEALRAALRCRKRSTRCTNSAAFGAVAASPLIPGCWHLDGFRNLGVRCGSRRPTQ